MMTERICISEIQSELQYKDRRSVRRWCHNNNVHILSYAGTYKQFVLKDEFEKAIFKSHNKHSESIKSTIFVSSKKRNNMKEYTPQGENEKEFLSIFTNTIATL